MGFFWSLFIWKDTVFICTFKWLWFLWIGISNTVCVQEQYYNLCGSTLTEGLRVLCGGPAHTVVNAKRSFTDTRTKRSSGTLMNFILYDLNKRSGVADECCISYCSLSTMIRYCDGATIHIPEFRRIYGDYAIESIGMNIQNIATPKTPQFVPFLLGIGTGRRRYYRTNTPFRSSRFYVQSTIRPHVFHNRQFPLSDTHT